jgi:HK97 family phage portal protein
MGFFDFFSGARRADIDPNVPAAGNADGAESDILRQRIDPDVLTGSDALKVPAVAASIRAVADIISLLPVRLYHAEYSESGRLWGREVMDDPRVRLLNDDSGDTLGAPEMWRAVIEDYYISRSGAYIFIERRRGEFASLRYVDPQHITTIKSINPIFKSYRIMINGAGYEPHQFIKVKRKTRDGIGNIPIWKESTPLLSVIKSSLEFEQRLVAKGGNKKGFLQSSKRLEAPALIALKQAWRKFYGRNDENVIVLNDGITFKESTNTSAEMQINENKGSNSAEVYGIFGVPQAIIKGAASEQENANFIRLTVMPVARSITAALNRDLLLEKEKGEYFFLFDFNELERGNMARRYKAYRDGIEGHFLKIDDVRMRENLPPIGLNGVTLDLGSAIYQPESGTVYTLNTNKTYDLKGDGTPAAGNDDHKGGAADRKGEQEIE